MSRIALTFTFPVLLSVILLSLAAAAGDYQGSFERKFQITAGARLEIDTGSWDVTVHSGPAGSVTITGRIHVNNHWLFGNQSDRIQELEKNPPVRQDGNTIQVGQTNLRNIYVEYEIAVPAECFPAVAGRLDRITSAVVTPPRKSAAMSVNSIPAAKSPPTRSPKF